MRRLCLILLVCLAAAPAAFAATDAAGDGVLELRSVYGNVTINAKGVLWGQMDKGSLTVTDPVAGDGDVLVNGADKPARVLPDGSVLYVGKDLHFRITGGSYKLQFSNGTGIDLTTVGVGKATILPDWTATDDGDYAVDGAKWKSVPFYDPLYLKFGVKPTPPPTTTTTGP
ncbi:MAG TPA: hypothetical protein VLK36_09065 [Gaiellaceae bacterium]|nr:hypothetical protein [Gaiellaceae bacterium]